MPACKTAYGLINNRLKYGSCKIFYRCPFINQRLYICLCKNSAACSYWVNNGIIFCRLVEPVSVSIEQNGHLVNKCTCTAGTCAVHPLLNSTAEEGNLCIFSAQFYYNICLRDYFLNSKRTGNNLLFKLRLYSFSQCQSS